MAEVVSIAEGIVQSVDTANKTVRVLHWDSNNSLSTDLPLMRPKPIPDEGDAALVVYLDNGAAYGICVGTPYQEEDTKAADIVDIAILPGGAYIQYNTATQTLMFSALHVTVNGTEVGG